MDVLGALGGLFGAIVPVFMLIVRTFHYRGEYMYLIGEIFGTAQSDTEVGKFIRKPRNTIQWNCCRVTFFNLKIRRIFRCCQMRLSRQDRLFAKSYNLVEKQCTVTNIMR